MIAFALADPNLPFAIALVLMLLIALLEGVTTVLGLGLSGFLDSLLPEMEMDIDVDMDGPDIDTGTPLTRMLSWLRIGQVPVLVLMVIFLTVFGLAGLFIQAIIQQVSGHMLPAFLASCLAFVAALPVVRLFGGILAKVVPKDETDAVSEKSFIGMVAVITTGTAKYSSPAQGKLKDRYGQTHYVMIEPDSEEEVFGQGSEVILVRQQGAIFKAIPNNSAALGSKDLTD